MSPNRVSWIITHGISGGFLGYDLFKAEPALSSIDECHYTCDAAIVYTYLHFRMPVTPQAIHSFMARMNSERHIILFEIFGYDSIASESVETELVDHVGFKILLEHYVTGNPSFKACTSGVSGVTRGLLWQHDFGSRLKECANNRSKRMGLFFEAMEAKLAEYKQKADMVDLYREQLMEYEAKVQERDHYKFVSHLLRIRIQELDNDTQETLLAPDNKGRALF